MLWTQNKSQYLRGNLNPVGAKKIGAIENDKNYLKTSDKFFIPNVYYYDREGIIWPTEWDTAYDSPYYNNGDDKTVYYKGRTYYVIKDDLAKIWYEDWQLEDMKSELKRIDDIITELKKED